MRSVAFRKRLMSKVFKEEVGVLPAEYRQMNS